MGQFYINSVDVDTIAEKVGGTSKYLSNEFFANAPTTPLNQTYGVNTDYYSVQAGYEGSVYLGDPSGIKTIEVEGTLIEKNQEPINVGGYPDLYAQWHDDYLILIHDGQTGSFAFEYTITYKYKYAKSVPSNYIYYTNLVGNKLMVNGTPTTLAKKGCRPLTTLRTSYEMTSYPTAQNGAVVATYLYIYKYTDGSIRYTTSSGETIDDTKWGSTGTIIVPASVDAKWLKIILQAAGGTGASNYSKSKSGSGGGAGGCIEALLCFDSTICQNYITGTIGTTGTWKGWAILMRSCGSWSGNGGNANASGNTVIQFRYAPSGSTATTAYRTTLVGCGGAGKTSSGSSAGGAGGTVTHDYGTELSIYKSIWTGTGGNGGPSGNVGSTSPSSVTLNNYANTGEGDNIVVGGFAVPSGYSCGGGSYYAQGMYGATGANTSHPAGKKAGIGAGGAGVISSTGSNRKGGYGGNPKIFFYY